jgi:hypothetical protein
MFLSMPIQTRRYLAQSLQHLPSPGGEVAPRLLL